MRLTKRTDEWRVLLPLFVAGTALRLMWLASEGPIAGTFGSAEASRVALAFANGRGIADAYYQGYGPTAHLMPVSPAIAGSILWLFGPGSSAGNLALLGWCLAQVGVAYWLLNRLFRSLGTEAAVSRWGTALLCLLAPFAPQETIDFRYWEGAAGLCLAAANLLLISRFERPGEPRPPQLMLIAALVAITVFVCPPAGIAAGACWAVFALRRLGWRRRAELALLTAATMALILTPWALRNQRALGEPIVLRSNLGLELALANYPGALSNDDPGRAFAERLTEIHPAQASARPPHRVEPGREAVYSQALGRQSWAWIRSNPAGFAALSLRHLSEYFFPRPWQMSFSGWGGMKTARSLAISLVDLLGLIGLALALARRRRGYWIVATYLGTISLPYMLFEPTARYIYLVYAPLAFLAAETVLGLVRAAPQQLLRAPRLVERRGGQVKQPEIVARALD